MNEIRLYKSKRKAFIFIATFLLLVMTGIFLIVNQRKVAGWSCIIFSAFILILAISMLLDRKPQLIMNDKGILDNRVLKQMVEWSEIQDAEDFFIRGQYYIRLILENNDKTSKLISPGFNRLNRMYENSGLKVVFIKGSMLNVNADSILQHIRKMAKLDHH